MRFLATFARAIAIALACTVALPSVATAQAQIAGVVRDTARNPIAGAAVSVAGVDRPVRSDTSGAFALPVAPGSHSLRVRALGYAAAELTVQVAANETQRVDVVLLRTIPQTLDTVTVRGRQPRGVGREAFEERRALGLGYFIDSTTLRRSENRRLSDLLRDVTGLAIRTGARGQQYATSSRYGCYVSIKVDGLWLYRGRASDGEPPDLRHQVANIMELEAIEFYRSSITTPMEFQGGGCGVLVLWTRRGRR